MGVSETPELPLAISQTRSQQRTSGWWRVVISLAAIGALSWTLLQPIRNEKDRFDIQSGCDQVPPLDLNLGELESIYASERFRNASIDRLSRIVQIPSISYDDMGTVEDDKRFKIFYEIEKYLQGTFPLVHSKLKKENVNIHGLLYTWEGSDKDLKPSILMAHQDVVPVEKSTIDNWTHPPFSGYYDGKYVWGRGASDCKNQLIAILEAVETLLNAGFKPKRTVILSFGFDEEISGARGAGTLAPRITELYGKDSIAAVVDEGADWISKWGAVYAAPAVGEKGYTDVHITVRVPGGHSSIPSDHTSIGIISELITLIEKDRYLPYLADNNPILEALQCGARYGTSFPKKFKDLLARRQHHHHKISPNSFNKCQQRKHSDPLAEAVAASDPILRYTMQTSQAVDLIIGGAKVNALPEKVEAVINHRINIGESTSIPQKRIAGLAAQVAKRHNLTLVAFPKNTTNITGHSITLTTSATNLEPAPSTPLDIFIPGTTVLSPWGVLSGTTRGLYGETIKMAPGLSTGNTDTRFYWHLTKHIFRYNPGHDPEDSDGGLGNIHTVDERQSVVAHINAVRWFAGWIKNVDVAVF